MEDESVRRCATREAHEELGIGVLAEDLHLVHTLHHRDEDDGHARIQLFFRVHQYSGQIANREPDKCAALRWWPLDALPDNTVPYTARALAAITDHRPYAECGWTT